MKHNIIALNGLLLTALALQSLANTHLGAFHEEEPEDTAFEDLSGVVTSLEEDPHLYLQNELFVWLRSGTSPDIIAAHIFQNSSIPTTLPSQTRDTLSRFQAIESTYALPRMAENPIWPDDIRRMIRIRFAFGPVISSVAAELRNCPHIELVEGVPDPFQIRKFQVATPPNEPLQDQQYSIKLTNLDLAWEISTGKNANIVVIDDALDPNHEEFQGRLLHAYDVADNDPDTRPRTPQSDHGAHVAAIAMAGLNNKGIAGVAPEARLIFIKATSDSSPPRALTHAYESTEYAINLNYPGMIFNMSWGGYAYSKTYETMFSLAKQQKGILFIAATGNDATNLPAYPATFSSVMAVSATNYIDSPAGFTNFGPHVDISAPGVKIMSVCANGAKCYMNKSGTSMAAPFVAGVAALIKSRNPWMTPDNIIDCIKNNAAALLNLLPVYENNLGTGRVDALAALLCNTPPLRLDISADSRYFIPPKRVNFTLPTMPSYNFEVDFGDGNSIQTSSSTFSHVYTTTSDTVQGVFDVTITARNPITRDIQRLIKKDWIASVPGIVIDMHAVNWVTPGKDHSVTFKGGIWEWTDMPLHRFYKGVHTSLSDKSGNLTLLASLYDRYLTPADLKHRPANYDINGNLALSSTSNDGIPPLGINEAMFHDFFSKKMLIPDVQIVNRYHILHSNAARDDVIFPPGEDYHSLYRSAVDFNPQTGRYSFVANSTNIPLVVNDPLIYTDKKGAIRTLRDYEVVEGCGPNGKFYWILVLNSNPEFEFSKTYGEQKPMHSRIAIFKYDASGWNFVRSFVIAPTIRDYKAEWGDPLFCLNNNYTVIISSEKLNVSRDGNLLTANTHVHSVRKDAYISDPLQNKSCEYASGTALMYFDKINGTLQIIHYDLNIPQSFFPHYDATFNEDSNILYTKSHTKGVYQFPIYNNFRSPRKVSNSPSRHGFSHMDLMPDSRIYNLSHETKGLSVVTKPNLIQVSELRNDVGFVTGIFADKDYDILYRNKFVYQKTFSPDLHPLKIYYTTLSCGQYLIFANEQCRPLNWTINNTEKIIGKAEFVKAFSQNGPHLVSVTDGTRTDSIYLHHIPPKPILTSGSTIVNYDDIQTIHIENYDEYLIYSVSVLGGQLIERQNANIFVKFDKHSPLNRGVIVTVKNFDGCSESSVFLFACKSALPRVVNGPNFAVCDDFKYLYPIPFFGNSDENFFLWLPKNLFSDNTTHNPNVIASADYSDPLNPKTAVYDARVIVSDSAGCSYTHYFTIEVHPKPAVTPKVVDIGCNKALVSFSGIDKGNVDIVVGNSPFTKKKLTNNEFILEQAVSGKHSLKYVYTTEFGCYGEGFVDVETSHSIPNVLSNTKSRICENATLRFDVSEFPGAKYLWSPAHLVDDATSANPLFMGSATKGTYILQRETDFGCGKTITTISLSVGDFYEMFLPQTIEIRCMSTTDYVTRLPFPAIYSLPRTTSDNPYDPQTQLPSTPILFDPDLFGPIVPISPTAPSILNPIQFPPNPAGDLVITNPYQPIVVYQNHTLFPSQPTLFDPTKIHADKIDPQFDGWSFNWSPAVDLDDPNVFMPVITTDTARDYTLTAISPEGCVLTGTVRVVPKAHDTMHSIHNIILGDTVPLNHFSQLANPIGAGPRPISVVWVHDPTSGHIPDPNRIDASYIPSRTGVHIVTGFATSVCGPYTITNTIYVSRRNGPSSFSIY